jgi:hypothetical protein
MNKQFRGGLVKKRTAVILKMEAPAKGKLGLFLYILSRRNL